MKKLEYQMPEVKAYELNMKGHVLLQASGDAPGDGGSGDGIDE